MKWTARLGVWLARRYPRVWRERYGDEFDALLADCPATLLDCLDITIGALDAHTMPVLSESLNERIMQMLNTVRKSEIVVFSAYIAFVVAGLYLNSTMDDSPYAKLMGLQPGPSLGIDLHDGLGLTWIILQAFALVALAAVLAGGLPIALSVWRRSPSQRKLFFIPVACFLGVTVPPGVAITALFMNGGHLPGALQGFAQILAFPYGIYGLWFIAMAVISTVAVTRAVAHSEISESLLRFALWASTATTTAMAIMLGDTLVWGLEAHARLPGDFDRIAFNGDPSVLSWGVAIVAMLAATLTALIATLRGIDATRQRGGSPDVVSVQPSA